jgi:hypothetical protein
MHGAVLNVFSKHFWERYYSGVTYEHAARGSLVVKALGYKPEGCGLEIRWGEILNLPNP